MEYYLFDVNALTGREDEALARLSPGRREKARRLRRGPSRLLSLGAGLLIARFFPGKEPLIAPGGKPYIPGGPEFSLSHSGTLAVIALADVPVGADAEKDRPVGEAVRLRALTGAERADSRDFLFFWTRKEAALKCLGTGVDRALDSLDVRADSAELDGRTIFLHTARFGSYYLSSAADGRPADFAPRELTLDQLLEA
ncbi:MAG: 4'-phosphopantetheinyl transferase superfamily protein [Oscillospiraceae bacterium]|nr:4'-phosphopantetheinyl transferase superfamily protein [Oscillospiraceae bacterium]